MHNGQSPHFSTRPDIFKRFAQSVLFAAASVSLIACGSDNASPGNDPVVIEPPVTEDTRQLVRSAMINIATPLEKNYSSIAAMANSLTDSPQVAQALKQFSAEDDTDRRIASTSSQQPALEPTLDIQSIMQLLFDENSGASTQRTENIVTINPDEKAVCDELAPDTNGDPAICTQYVQQFDVQINASSDEAGIADLRFQQQSVVSISYSPTSSIIKVRLQGVQSALQYLMDLENEGETMPETMQGTIELSASIDSVTNTSQSTAALAITDKITITDSSEQFSLAVDPSRMSASADASTETMDLTIELNGMNFSEVSETGSTSETALFEMSLPNFTAHLQMSGSESVAVSRLGFGKGPFQITVDDAEMIRLTLAQFGFQIDGETGILTINQDMDFGLLLDNSTGALDEELPTSFTAMFSANAPAGTALLEQDNEIIQVISNGPIAIEYAINDGNDNPAGSFSAAAGQCFSLLDQSEQILTEVPCD